MDCAAHAQMCRLHLDAHDHLTAQIAGVQVIVTPPGDKTPPPPPADNPGQAA